MGKDTALHERTLWFIQDIIGPQLQKPERKKVNVFNQTFLIDYCFIEADPKIAGETILLLPGFGSGWTGIAKLGFDLAMLGYKVCMVSLPGYGNSSDPPAVYYNSYSFGWEAYTLGAFIKSFFPEGEVNLIGHSIAAYIITESAFIDSNHFSSLTLLNPSGFEKRGKLELAVKFAAEKKVHSRRIG